MKNITFLYIFALYVLFVPGFMFKQHKWLHSVLFSVCLYFTYNLINRDMESYETSLEIKGATNLGDLIEKKEKESNTVVINNKIKSMPKTEYESQNNDLLSTSFKTVDNLEKENKNLQRLLKGYEGDKSQIGLLHSDIDSYKNQITDLKTQLNSYQGTDKSADELNALVNKLQSQNTSLKTQLANAKQKPQ